MDHPVHGLHRYTHALHALQNRTRWGNAHHSLRRWAPVAAAQAPRLRADILPHPHALYVLLQYRSVGEILASIAQEDALPLPDCYLIAHDQYRHPDHRIKQSNLQIELKSMFSVTLVGHVSDLQDNYGSPGWSNYDTR